MLEPCTASPPCWLAARWLRWPFAFAAKCVAISPANRCSLSRFCICSFCSPCCWSIAWRQDCSRRCGHICRPEHETAMNERNPAPKPEPGIRLTEQQQRARRARSIAIAISLGVLVVLFYIVTLVKGPGVLERPL